MVIPISQPSTPKSRADGFVHVAVGIIVNRRGEVLISRRPDNVQQGGLWEFPGGKVEPNENIEAALARELREELGIRVLAARPLIRVRHAYSKTRVLLDVWCVDDYRGDPRGLEGQPLCWLVPEALPSRAFPAADMPIINALRLPSKYLITDDSTDCFLAFLKRLEQALKQGIGLVQLRAKQLPEDKLRDLYQRAQALGRSYGVPILLNGDSAQAQDLGADGVHLTADRLRALHSRPLTANRWVAASCHNRTELQHACRLGIDFVVVSPVRATASHPNAVPLGWEGLRRLTEEATLPVYALGGMIPADLQQAWRNGAQGIAAVRSLW